MTYLPFLLVMAIISCCLETDISVPGFPEMVKSLHTTKDMVQLTLSINFLGFCIAGLFYGPLSDSLGRRPILLIGNLLFLIGAIGTVTSATIDTLIFWRLVQGLGASASMTLVFAMIADAYQGPKAAGIISMINSLITALLALAPLIGGVLCELYGWQSTFLSVAILCSLSTILIFFYLPETNTKRVQLDFKSICRNYMSLMKNRDFLSLTSIPTLVCAGYMAFVGSAVFFYIEKLHLSITEFTLHQSVVVACFSVLSMVSGRLNERFGSIQMTWLGIFLSTFGSALMLYFTVASIDNSYLFTGAMTFFALGAALSYGPCFAASLEVAPDIKGAASALNGSLRLVLISFCIWLVGVLPNENFISTAIILLAVSSFSAFLARFVFSQAALRKMFTESMT